MELEKIINHQFKDPSQKLIAELLFSASWLENKFVKELAPTGLSFQQLNVLRIISGQKEGRANVQVIKDRMIDNRSNVSRLLNKLCEKGYTQKDRCTEDQRVVYIELTPSGEKMMKSGREAIEKINFSLDQEKLNQLNSLLEELRK